MSSLLTTLLFVTVVGVTANQTILNTNYIEKNLENQQAYDRLSDALSKDIGNNTETSAIPQSSISAGLKVVLTPDVLRVKINSTLTQLQAYYRGNGPVPTIDISDLVQQAQQSGFPIDAGKYNQPVELSAATKAKQVSDVAKYVSIGMLIIIALLLAGVVAIAIKRRDLRPLANIVFSLGLMLTITGGALLVVPRVFSQLYKFDPVTNPFGALAHDLAVSAIHDFGIRLVLPGLAALVLGGLAKFALRSKHHKHKGHPAATQNPTATLPYKPMPATAAPSQMQNQVPTQGETQASPSPIETVPSVQPPITTDSPQAAKSDAVPGAPPRAFELGPAPRRPAPGAPPRPGTETKSRKIQL